MNGQEQLRTLEQKCKTNYMDYTPLKIQPPSPPPPQINHKNSHKKINKDLIVFDPKNTKKVPKL
jgi:hypothetical protein